MLVWKEQESPKEVDLRVWYYRDGRMFHMQVESIEQARRVIAEQIRLDLQCQGVSNDFGLEVYTLKSCSLSLLPHSCQQDSNNGDWLEWRDNAGNDIRIK